MNLPLCECGCGKRVTRKGNRFLVGHRIRLGNPMKRPELREWVSRNNPMKRPEVSIKISGERNPAHQPKVKKKKSLAMQGSRNPMYGRRGPLHPSYGKTLSDETKRKISLANRGKKRSQEERARMSLRRQGENNANWRGGTALEPYAHTFPDFKVAILERDGYTCQLCAVIEDLCPHHINYVKTDDRVENGVCLCTPCNSKVNGNREFWERFFTWLVTSGA